MIKTIAKNFLTSAFVSRLVNMNDESVGSILTLHRVDNIDKNRLRLNEHLKISPEYLDSLILDLKKNRCSFVSIEELQQVLVTKKSATNLICFTLDDGYRDNFEQAWPIFKHHNVPFTLYLSTAIPDKIFIYWWYILEDIILLNNEVILSDGTKYSCNTRKKKEQTFLLLREKILKSCPLSYKNTIPQLFSPYPIDLSSYNESLSLDWAQIELLNVDPLVTIGCHTHAHIALKPCSVDEIEKDINYSREKIKKHTNRYPEHFCYPYGDSLAISNREIDIIKTMGFKTAVTTNAGNIYHKDAENIHALSRIFVTEKPKLSIVKTINWMKYKAK